MKRSASSSKENGHKFRYSKVLSRKKPLQHHPNAFTGFNRNPSCLHPNTGSEVNTPNPFYQTLGSNNFMEWKRPQSKQAYRKFFTRPQTSKGARPLEKPHKKWEIENKSGNYNSQYMPDRMNEAYKEEQESNIEIIVTKSKRKIGQRQKESKSRFETDLDDEFLQLFAN